MSTYDWELQSPPDAGNTVGQIAYDVARQKIVLFTVAVGPGIYDVDNQTWTWDPGGGWVQEFPGTSPPGRLNGRMCWDEVNQGVLLFGGQTDAVTFKSDTWLWDGTTWTNMAPSTTPTARMMQGLCRDPNNNVVMFGGFKGGSPSRLGDTWLWDGTDWALQSPASDPGLRERFAMCEDTTNGNVVLYGGTDGTTPNLSDTWLWDGTDWAQQFPANDLGPRQLIGAAFISALGVLVYGGFANFIGEFNDTWLWDGTDWELQSPVTNPGQELTDGKIVAYPPAAEIMMYAFLNPGGNDPATWLYKPFGGSARVMVRMFGWRTEIDDNSNETTTLLVSPQDVIT